MKKRIFSGIQPSGNLHIGNYLGAIKNWVALQDEYDSIFCVVDMHAITVPQDPEQLRQKTIEIAKIYLASGIDPKKCSIFIQSQISEHAELMWILNTISRMSDLFRMTQFKDKSGVKTDLETIENVLSISAASNEKQYIGTNNENKVSVDAYVRNYIDKINKVEVGLFSYPVLMAADIILYGTEIVPVGEDQKQHVELARDLAKRFNHRFGDTFIIPKSHIKEEGMRIMGLDTPEKKMSKSAPSEYNRIDLLDDPEMAKKKIMKAVTDSGSEIIYTDEKPAIKNLIDIYSALGNISSKEIETKYKGKGYGDFKKDLAGVVAAFLTDFQKKYNAISDDEVLAILHEGAEKVRPIAKKKLDEVKGKVGFII
ncbi:MAG: tryptophan--tRNA ligase [Candidatus Moranbacteria bacterium]|nr:tryptophan--tRNA ligase [Candidatus Moranbacteria bacterium]